MRTSKVFFSFNCWCQPKFSSTFDPLIKFHFEVNDWSSLTCILAIRAKRSEETQHASGCFMSAEKEGGSKTDPLACGRCLHESLWYGGSSVDIWHCWIMALLPCWSRPGQPHAIHAPVTYQKHIEEGIQRDAILFSILVTVTRFLGAVLCN